MQNHLDKHKTLGKFFTKTKKGNTWEMATLTFHEKRMFLALTLEKKKANLVVRNY